ncbi:ClbS/DfsB family four-helix bundle protein [Paenibacillus sp. Z6-24]
MPYIQVEELVDEIRKRYTLLDQEFDDVDEKDRHLRIEDVDRTPYEMLAYQLGWLHLLLGWEADELRGQSVVTPAPGYKWNQLGGLYQQFYDDYRDCSLAAMRTLLRQYVDQCCDWLETLREEELFQPGQRQWAANQAQWPIWKWVHINTVAPFKTFRTRIRKWKRLAGGISKQQ